MPAGFESIYWKIFIASSMVDLFGEVCISEKSDLKMYSKFWNLTMGSKISGIAASYFLWLF